MSTAQTSDTSTGSKKFRFVWVAPLLLSLFAYSNAPWNELVWDDPIVFERQMSTIRDLQDIFIIPQGVAQWSPDYYRPVIVLSYLLDLRLYRNAELGWMGLSDLQKSGVFITGENASGTANLVDSNRINRAQIAGLHIANVIYHALTTLFVWMLAARLFARLPNGAIAALLAASVFAVHPVHVESVSWVAGRSDLLATLFLVPSVTLALIWRDSGAQWALLAAAFLYLLALLSKEVAIAGLLILPAALLLAPAGPGGSAEAGPLSVRRQPLKLLSSVLLLAGLTGLYFYLRHTDGAAYGIALDVPLLNYLARLEKSVSFYLVKVVWPWPQSLFTGWAAAPGSLLANFAVMVALVLAYLGIVSFRRQKNGLPLFALLWFALALAPSIAVAMRSIAITPLAERYLYLPSVGFALLLGVLMTQFVNRAWLQPALAAALLIVAGYAVATFERGKVWADNLALWADTTSKSPEFGDPWNQLGVAYLSQRDYGNAMRAFRHATEGLIGPAGRASANHNIAIIYQLQDDLENAEQYYRLAIAEQSGNPELNYGLGVLYKTRAGNLQKTGGSPPEVVPLLRDAQNQFEQTLQSNPFHALARWGLASVLVLQGQLQEAGQNPQRALRAYRRAGQELDQLRSRHPGFGNRPEVRQATTSVQGGIRRLREGAAVD